MRGCGVGELLEVVTAQPFQDKAPNYYYLLRKDTDGAKSYSSANNLEGFTPRNRRIKPVP